MGRLGIDYHDVAQAIAELQGSGKSPTVDNIRLILGTGSKTTINRFLHEWKQKQEQPLSESSVPPELLQMIKGLWQALVDKTNDEATLYKQKIDDQLKEYEQQYLQAQHNIQSLQSTLHTAQEEKSILEHEKNQLFDNYKQTKESNIQLTERNNAIKQQMAQIQKEQANLHQLLTQAQSTIKQNQEKFETLRQENALALTQKEQEYQEKISYLEQEKTSINHDNVKLQFEVEQFKTSQQQLKADNNHLSENIQLLQKEIMIKTSELQSLTKSYQQISENYHHDQKLLNKLKTEKQSLEIEIKFSKEQYVKLEASFEEAQAQIQNLNNSLLQANQENSLLLKRVDTLELVE